MVLDRSRSEALFAEAQKRMPGGVNSPVRAFRAVGGAPIFAQRGEGAWLVDEDGNRFLDNCMSWGPLVVGHAHPHVVGRLADALGRGTSFGMPCKAEIDLAEAVLARLGRGGRIRFVNSGTEAVMTALRLARGVTSRPVIAKFSGCYHGHADYLLVKAGSGLATFGTASSAGVPESMTADVLVLPLDAPAQVESALREVGDRLAAVVIEAIPANNGLLLQQPDFLSMLRTTTRSLGALLVADEVLTGFRVSHPLVSLTNGLDPDILTLGKVIGGGLPVGAVWASTAIMNQLAPEGPVYQAGTLSGNPLGMVAGCATLEALDQDGGDARLEFLGERLEKGVRSLVHTLDIPVQVARAGSIFWLAFDADTLPRSAEAISADSMQRYGSFHAAMLDRGIYLAPSGYEVGFLSTAHTEGDVDHTLDAMEASLRLTYG